MPAVERSLCVLIVVAGSDPLAESLVAGMNGHCVLVCESGDRAVAVVRNGYVPDVVFVDSRLTGSARLVDDLSALAGRADLPCVALRHPFSSPTSGFDGEVNLPATALELEVTLATLGTTAAA